MVMTHSLKQLDAFGIPVWLNWLHYRSYKPGGRRERAFPAPTTNMRTPNSGEVINMYFCRGEFYCFRSLGLDKRWTNHVLG